MAMITSKEAESALEGYKRSLGIPPQARLAFIEKRYIELADREEIEPSTHMIASEEDVEFEPDAGGKPAAGPEEESLPVYAERQAWIGKYVHEVFFWELALDRAGNLIRLRKSR